MTPNGFTHNPYVILSVTAKEGAEKKIQVFGEFLIQVCLTELGPGKIKNTRRYDIKQYVSSWTSRKMSLHKHEKSLVSWRASRAILRGIFEGPLTAQTEKRTDQRCFELPLTASGS